MDARPREARASHGRRRKGLPSCTEEPWGHSASLLRPPGRVQVTLKSQSLRLPPAVEALGPVSSSFPMKQGAREAVLGKGAVPSL